MKVYYDLQSNSVILEGQERLFANTLVAEEVDGKIAIRDKKLDIIEIFREFEFFQKQDGSYAGTNIQSALDYLNSEFELYTDIAGVTQAEVDQSVNEAIVSLIGNAPETLDTLNELAEALNDNDNFASSITTQLSEKANISDLSTVATSNNYNDLDNLPTLLQGEVGPQGEPGADSIVPGPQGLKGDIGEVGPQGLPGIQGEKGDKGDQGDVGPQGEQGLVGPQGPAGIDGTPGLPGADGPQGIQGTAGNNGLQGIQGETGDTGPQGIQGLPGSDGPQGPVGPQGEQGPSGVPGNASELSYDNTTSGLTADNTQSAIDEINDLLPDTTLAPIATTEDAANAASGSSLGVEQGLLAAAGQPGLTVLAVGYTNTGKVQGVSLGAGNVIEVYANGNDFNSGDVLYREFMNLGEPICFTGLSNGAIITSTQGFYGFSEQRQGADESPMPLLSYGLSFKSTFFFAFRNCQTYAPNGTSGNQGWVHVVNGPLPSTVKLTNGSGVTVQGQEGIVLAPWEYRRLYTSGNQEYIVDSTNPVMACHNANMNNNPSGRFYDSRLIMPLTNDGITWPRSGFVSAPYDNTIVNWFTRDNAQGSLNSGNGVSPGTPIDFDAASPLGTGANDADYEPNGATRVLATGLISAYSGADSAGLEASPLMPTSAMSQVVAQPLTIDDAGDGGSSGVSIASPFVGTAKVYEYNTGTGNLDLAYTVPLNRNGVTVNSKEDQKHPSAGMVANETVGGAVSLVGQLNPGVVIADVPITVVVQNATPTVVPTIRSQNGTTTSGIVNDDDETLSLGITPATLKAEITEGSDGILYKRVISGGSETWNVA